MIEEKIAPLFAFSMFKQPKGRIKMAALILTLPTEATIEQETKKRTDRHHSTYTEDHKLFKKFGLTHQDTS